MNTLGYVRDAVIPTAFLILPTEMASVEAKAMLLAIGLQESGFLYRRQMAGGPARGFWQFEIGGVKAVLGHVQSKVQARRALSIMRYDTEDPIASYAALEHNDILAAIFARLLLWTHPKPLPKRGEAEQAWDYYLDTWRPGKPKRERWEECYRSAWSVI
jgi:hypothetical protein